MALQALSQQRNHGFTCKSWLSKIRVLFGVGAHEHYSRAGGSAQQDPPQRFLGSSAGPLMEEDRLYLKRLVASPSGHLAEFA
jgi:hypothetical protein